MLAEKLTVSRRSKSKLEMDRMGLHLPYLAAKCMHGTLEFLWLGWARMMGIEHVGSSLPWPMMVQRINQSQ